MTRETRRDFWITLADSSSWAPERRAEEATEWQAALQKSKGFRKPCHCNCVAKEAPLYIFQRAGVFYLARYPNSGHFHRTDCRFYDAPIETNGRSVYTDEVVSEADDGRKSVRFDFALGRVVGEREPAQQPVVPREQSTVKRSQMSILGLLHFLWTNTDLHRWHPKMTGRRNWAVLKNVLDEAAGEIIQNRIPLAQRLIVMPAQPGPNLHQNVDGELAAKVAWATSNPKRIENLIFVGELVNAKIGDNATCITLSWAGQHKLKFYCSTNFWQRCIESNPGLATYQRVKESEDKVVAILTAEVRKRPDGNMIGDVSSAAFLFTTAEFIPYASSYERTVARALIAQNRWFEKPLRYDASEEQVFPDFILLDTASRHLPMEVYGRNNDDEYKVRREQKRALYLRTYGADEYWEWLVDPSNLASIPPFPRKIFQRASA